MTPKKAQRGRSTTRIVTIHAGCMAMIAQRITIVVTIPTQILAISTHIHHFWVGEFVKKGWTLVFGQHNVHVIKGSTGELIKQIMNKAE